MAGKTCALDMERDSERSVIPEHARELKLARGS